MVRVIESFHEFAFFNNKHIFIIFSYSIIFECTEKPNKEYVGIEYREQLECKYTYLRCNVLFVMRCSFASSNVMCMQMIGKCLFCATSHSLYNTEDSHCEITLSTINNNISEGVL